jgi:hypothetical protein
MAGDEGGSLRATYIVGVLLEELGLAARRRAAGDLVAQLGQSIESWRRQGQRREDQPVKPRENLPPILEYV